jgi:uncharacterized protein
MVIAVSLKPQPLPMTCYCEGLLPRSNPFRARRLLRAAWVTRNDKPKDEPGRGVPVVRHSVSAIRIHHTLMPTQSTPQIRVDNLTRGTPVVVSGRIARTFMSRFRGLMGVPSLAPGAGLVIEPCSSIHTHFMRFPIDVLYVDRDHVIVGIDRNLRPWWIGRFYKKVHYVVELPTGGAAGCLVGDQLQIRAR